MSKTILVADDEDAPRRAAVMVLKMAGYQIVEAADGEEALAKALEHKPALLVLDMMMPKKHGHEVCAALRQRDDELKSVPVITLTGLDVMLGEDLAAEAGSQKYLNKPVNPRELLDTVKQLLGES